MLTNKQQPIHKLELWGGIECTINRINDTSFDQLEYANHYTRENDLDLIANLGIKTLRYPILWERHQPASAGQINWDWTEKQLNFLQSKGIRPIAGLLHHGSGPSYTSLLDENFPELFAKYAATVAEKFPWIEYYTPVNEPLTTARFSGLYGFWYPHKKNDTSFARMLLNQMKGVVLAMEAIRKINPEAKLIQTEDLGKTYSTPLLQYQARFENERRWLTYDLLCGKVQPGHSMWEYFFRLGIAKETLDFFIENSCPPDIMGFNYYVTSERFIDENIEKYPLYTYGGNELHVYADIEAVRVVHNQESGLEILLKEAWQRYKLPISITEAQLNCGREDQIRWLKEVWETCGRLKEDGMDIRAVTAWALFGSFGWDKLLTSEQMNYEPGVFDVRSGVPRLTELTSFIRSIATTQNYIHPVLVEKGWWHRDIRFEYDPEVYKISCMDSSQPLLIIGSTGTLGNAFGQICKHRGICYKLLGRKEVDITNERQIDTVIQQYNPWAIINAAGFVRVDDAETEWEQCFNANTKAPYLLALACKKAGVQFMTFSSDLVFDGTKNTGYVESDFMNPMNVYGQSKMEAETAVFNINPNALVIRTSSFFGPWDEHNFVTIALKTVSANNIFIAASDVVISPTYVPDLVNVSLDLLIDKEKGVWHLTNDGETTWSNFAHTVCEIAGLDTKLIQSLSVEKLNLKAKRPKYTVLQSEKGILLPTLDNAIDRYFNDVKKLAAIHQPADLDVF